ncbi:MAG: cation diffusion facilitator family transporter [Candidatus Gastranaerophilales bacterium]|nr:cation diffusion facilitator family transporter [Candidatus Gastranaerophilales bacterium]
MNIEKEKKIAAKISIISNITIIILKTVAGVVSGSISLISEAVHSLSDLLASVLTLFAVMRSSRPADKEHPFGHGKYEDMSGFIEGILIILAGVYIIYEASVKLIFGHTMKTEPVFGIYVMAFAIIINIFVSRHLFKISKKADSVAIYADAQHLRSDVYSSFGVMMGLVLINKTGIDLLDPIIALLVATIIIKTGYSISKRTLNNLLDGSLPPAEIKEIESILKNKAGIKGYKDLKARKAGHCNNIEVTIFFEADKKISYCHKICDEIEDEIKKRLADINITIHSEPEMPEQLVH